MAKLKQSHLYWISLALVANLIGIPTGIAVKIGTDSVDPMVFTSVRYLIVGLVLLPYVLTKLNRINRKNIKFLLFASIATVISGVSYSNAIQQGQVSVVSIVGLITPVIFILLSLIIVREKINRGSVVGILVTLLGAMILITAPSIVNDGVSNSTPSSAIFLAIVDAIFYSVIIIYLRKADESGMPAMASIGIVSIVTAVITGLFALSFSGSGYIASWTNDSIAAVMYSALAAALLSRWLTVESYERLGSFVTSALSYVQYFLAVILPIVILRESLSFYTIISGVFIFIGVVLTDKYHKNKKMKYAGR